MSHEDFLGRELSIGDHIVYPTGSGSTKKVCVAEILEFIDTGTSRWRYHRSTQSYTEEAVWKVRVQPKVFNDYRETETWGYVDGKYQKIGTRTPKTVVWERIENMVKVELPDG